MTDQSGAAAAERRPSFFRDLSLQHVANGIIGFVFAASGPVAIILAAGARGGLGHAELASWIFGAFVLNGFITLAFSVHFRQPLVFFWTIPGTVLVGPALAHATFPEVVGAFVAAGAAMAVLGMSGLVRRAMAAVPLPIVMGMVSGVFLPFGLDWIRALGSDAWIAVPMTAVFVVLSALPALGRWLPPLIAALAVGAGLVAAGTAMPAVGDLAGNLAAPVLVVPALSWRAMLELVVPLIITVLVVQNGQGVAVLSANGHRPPVDAIATACGIGSMVAALVGTVSTCLTGPVNAIISGSGERRGQYTAAVVVALLGMGFGLLAPLFTRLMLAAPAAFVVTLAGLAMLRVLETAFRTAFKGPFTLGALVTFLVTVSGLSLLNVGAPFWGILAGLATSWLIERADFRAALASS
jgi:benzoate membrane transport protein